MSTTTILPPCTDIELNDRFLNLVLINFGEAITEFGNVRQRGGKVGRDYANVRLSLLRALSALNGELWTAPPNEIEV
jgi:hypothetical protein